MDNWKETTLEEVAENIFSGGTPNTQKSEYWNGNLNWLSSGETGQRFIYDTERKITKLGASESSTRLANAGNIVIATAGQGNTRGQVSFLKIDSYINQSVIAINANAAIADNKWLFYNLSNRYYELRFISEANSIRGSLTTKIIESLEVLLPPLPGQKTIAAILSSFDDKIELLRRQNKTLESIAQTIFKEWFVKFTVNGKKLKLNSKTGLPEGWRMGKLTDVIEVSPVRNLKKGQFAPYLAMKGTPTQGHHAEGWYKREFSSGSKFANGDTLLARITPCLENGKTAFVEFLDEKQVGWGSTEFIVLRPKPPFHSFYGYLLARSNTFRNFAIGQMTGSSGRQRVPEDSLANFDIVIPSDDVVVGFGELINPIVQRLTVSAKENQTLSKLRDALLPKLMKGEIRVKS